MWNLVVGDHKTGEMKVKIAMNVDVEMLGVC